MRLVIVSAAAVATLAPARPAVACGVPDFGEAIAQALSTSTEPVETPLVAFGFGVDQWSVAAGYGWGEKVDDIFFPGSTITRVMFDVRNTHTLSTLSLTYGWYQNKLMSAGFDLGAEATTDGEVGPTTRVSLGFHGVDLQLRGAVVLGPQVRAEGSAQVVFELMDLTGRL